ncbi:MAG: sigma-70 family RNA polymerase sigma factor [Clostridiales bacterium]|nr:sigma-70 family RNA polymerase sigma factor [Clostridiales bacterium]
MKKWLKLISGLLSKFSISSNSILMYLSSGESLPEILDEEEEKVYLDLLMNGDESAKQKLIEHNLRLVVYVAKKFASSEVDIEDLISIGSLGLIKAVNSFRADKNIKIATYASKCIENEILMYLRKISKQKQVVSLDEPLSNDGEGNELVLFDIVPSASDCPQENMEKKTEKEILWSVINKLNGREKEIMIMRFGLSGGEELTQKEVADSLGISQSYISRLEKKIVIRIKKEILKLA